MNIYKAISEHSDHERKQISPGAPDTYRETCYIRDDANESFRVISLAIETNILCKN